MSAAVVRRVDHVNFRVADPRPLFSLLTQHFELPLVWPVTRFPSFENGSIGLGNMTLEPTNYAPGSAAGGPDGELFSICLEPEPVVAATEELARRGIPHSPPIPYVGRWPESASTVLFHPHDSRPEKATLWTWIFLGDFLGDRAQARRWSNPLFRSRRVASLIGRAAGSDRLGPRLAARMGPRRPYPFCCQWDAFDIEAFRQRAADELRHRAGGPLGLVGVREIVASVSDLSREIGLWRGLLDPAPEVEAGHWKLGDGPAVRLVEGEADAVEAMVWEVASLARAVAFLGEKRLLVSSTDSGARIAPAALHGLDVRLVEAARARTREVR